MLMLWGRAIEKKLGVKCKYIYMAHHKGTRTQCSQSFSHRELRWLEHVGVGASYRDFFHQASVMRYSMVFQQASKDLTSWLRYASQQAYRGRCREGPWFQVTKLGAAFDQFVEELFTKETKVLRI